MHEGMSLGKSIIQLERTINSESLTLEDHEKITPRQLAGIYTEMCRGKELLTKRDLRAMIASYKNRHWKNSMAAAVLALGDTIAEEVQQGQPLDKESFDYLKWNISQPKACRPEAIEATCKIMTSQVSRGNEPDWPFLQSLLLLGKDEDLRGLPSETKIRNGIASVLQAYEPHLPKASEASTASFDYLKRHTDSWQCTPEPQEQNDPHPYVQRVRDGELSVQSWRNDVFEKEISRYDRHYGVSGQTLRNWYDKSPSAKIPACNAALATSFGRRNPNIESNHKMTNGFRFFSFL